jgi:hypothetical protein
MVNVPYYHFNVIVDRSYGVCFKRLFVLSVSMLQVKFCAAKNPHDVFICDLT